MENGNRHLKTPEERKQELEEALKRVRPAVMEHKGSVNKRLEEFANRKIEEPQNDNAQKKVKKPLSLSGLAKQKEELDKKAQKSGIEMKDPNRVKDSDEKTNDKNKEKDKDKDKDKEMTPEKQEQKMKEMFSKVKLPSGMEIHQEGPSWVLVSKDGKQRTDVTDVMNTIDKFNRNVDAANEENRMQNNVQNSADKAVDDSRKGMTTGSNLQVDETNGKAAMVSEALPMVKDADGNQVFKPEDIRAMAETAISASEEGIKLTKLKDPQALDKMKKREKDNERKAEERVRALQNQRLADRERGGR